MFSFQNPETQIQIYILSKLFQDKKLFLSKPDTRIFKKIKKIYFLKSEFRYLPQELCEKIVESHIKYLDYDPLFAKTLRNNFFEPENITEDFNNFFYTIFIHSKLFSYLARNLLTAWISNRINDIYTINQCILLNLAESKTSNIFFQGDTKKAFVKNLLGIYIRRLRTRHFYEYLKFLKILKSIKSSFSGGGSLNFFTTISCESILPLYTYSYMNKEFLLVPNLQSTNSSFINIDLNNVLVDIKMHFKNSNFKMLEESLDFLVDNFDFSYYPQFLANAAFWEFTNTNTIPTPTTRLCNYCLELIFNIAPVFIYYLVTSTSTSTKNIKDFNIVKHLWKKYIHLLKLDIFSENAMVQDHLKLVLKLN